MFQSTYVFFFKPFLWLGELLRHLLAITFELWSMSWDTRNWCGSNGVWSLKMEKNRITSKRDLSMRKGHCGAVSMICFLELQRQTQTRIAWLQGTAYKLKYEKNNRTKQLLAFSEFYFHRKNVTFFLH